MANIGTAKYVICRDDDMGMEYPIIFPYYVNHSTFKDMQPIRAGFVTFDSITGWETFGVSLSLELESHESDAQIIKATLGNSFPIKS